MSALTRKEQDELAETRSAREAVQPYAAEMEDREAEKAQKEKAAAAQARRDRSKGSQGQGKGKARQGQGSPMTGDNEGMQKVEPDNIKAPEHYHEGRSQLLTTDTGRQGPSGFRVLVVLVASLAAAAILWIIGAFFGLW